MTTLSIPLHIPMMQLNHLMTAELSHRDVQSVKVDRERGLMVIEHERRPITVRDGYRSSIEL